MKLLTSQWMREIDTRAIEEVGIPSLVLMENAARGAARWFRECFPPDCFSHALVLAGSGNNGGDGMAVARILTDWGMSVSVCLMADPARLSSDSGRQLAILTRMGVAVHVSPNEASLKKLCESLPRGNSFLVDALLGIGIDRPVTAGPIAGAIRTINASGLPVAAVDVPSGLSEKFLPQTGLCVRAACTATFHALKRAHLFPDGNDCCGDIRVLDIGIPAMAEEGVADFVRLITPELAFPMAAPRPVAAHKNHFGHVLSIAGSTEKPGAGYLCAYAALRGGAGLSTLALPGNSLPAAVYHPEVMSVYWHEVDEVFKNLSRFHAIAAGPGLGVEARVKELVDRLLLEAKVPLVLDADALNVLAGDAGRLKNASVPLVITPHPGEFSRLTGWSAERILADRVEAAREFAREYNLVVVLKGHHSVVASPQGRVWLNATGNPGMATAGSGDVLTGFLTARVAQMKDHHALDEVCAAVVYLHGRAGDLAAKSRGETGMTAGDLLNELPAAIQTIHEDPGPFGIVR